MDFSEYCNSLYDKLNPKLPLAWILMPFRLVLWFYLLPILLLLLDKTTKREVFEEKEGHSF